MSFGSIVSPGFGLEKISTGAMLALLASLNSELAYQASLWAPWDQSIATARGIAYKPVHIEPVDPSNLYVGHRPSLVEAPIDRYPNVAVMAHQASPIEPEQDHVNAFEVEMYAELMVKGEGEKQVNSRIARSSDAVANVIIRDRTLGGNTFEMTRPPNINITDVFKRREDGSHGRQWFWQGARLEFAYTRYANIFG